ncbi:hypothetical protein EV195_10386 [Tenacibaculum skagerrakense]|uniref:Uncharacterized protein n=1 Tax=Tenacibaculum skagerrakense TaxID=186571 RepID=A0A4R2NUX1_9FLAO|nr:hypothetical protein [Tenacibaculum skagerrakense]TCP25727.1 hypothetical protein EV195_10386 [Tenacibaculum skagerrakense]
MKKNPNWPICKPGKPGNGYSSLHKKNFNVLLKESYFNPSKKYVSVKIPCPKKDFEIQKVYEVSSDIFLEIGINVSNLRILLIHISEPTAASTLGLDINFFLDGKILFDEIYDLETCQPIKFDIKNHESLLVITLNDDKDLCSSKILDNKIDKLSELLIIKPEEAGGGVIVTGP